VPWLQGLQDFEPNKMGISLAKMGIEHDLPQKNGDKHTLINMV
jgi:hypothetical protein